MEGGDSPVATLTALMAVVVTCVSSLVHMHASEWRAYQ